MKEQVSQLKKLYDELAVSLNDTKFDDLCNKSEDCKKMISKRSVVGQVSLLCFANLLYNCLESGLIIVYLLKMDDDDDDEDDDGKGTNSIESVVDNDEGEEEHLKKMADRDSKDEEFDDDTEDNGPSSASRKLY